MAVPPLVWKLANMTSPETTPIGLAIASVVPLAASLPFELPPRRKISVVLLVTSICGLESIAVAVPPAPLCEPVVKVEKPEAPGAVTPVPWTP